ncbi:RNA polymerase sigma factor [Parapedobacter sp. GCM10030251]|uniref:RNA polymerase sigma factor n=1 Tax=Parapedobacter sp. GCM10030251 TaxID=3273419 RepID=UPI0036197A0B
MEAKPLTDERELLSRVVNGDQRAFRILYDHYYPKVYGYALYLLKSVVLAEETVQFTFLKLWTIGEGARKIDHLEPFLVRICRNRALDFLRRQKLQVRIDRETHTDWSESHNETEEVILLNDTRRLLDEAVQSLPPQQKRVYQLCHQQGLKYEEAARELDLSTATVQSYMKHALRALRKHLSRHTDIAAMLVIFKLL